MGFWGFGVLGIFNVSMGLSALRCLLSYVVFPIVTPLVGAATSVGPAIGIPIAAGVLYPTFGILLNPVVAALAMSLSSVSVIGNALRLRAAKL